MRRFPKPWLAGAAIAEVDKTDAGIRIMLNIFIKSNGAFAVVRCLDRNEQTIVDDDGKPLSLYNFDMRPTGPRPIPFGRRYQRSRQLFGRYSQFFHDSIVFDVPKDQWRKVAYLELDILTRTLGEKAGRKGESSTLPSDWIHLEMSRRKLMAFGKNRLFLLITKDEAARRMKRLIRKKPVLLGLKHAIMQGLSELMVLIYRGGDTPLLTEDLG